jgi:hypothetical protein
MNDWLKDVAITVLITFVMMCMLWILYVNALYVN